MQYPEVSIWIRCFVSSLNSPQIFFGQQAPSSSTSSTYSPSLSHSGVETELQSGSTATTEPFSIHLYRQQPRSEPFHTSLGARGLPSLSVHTGYIQGRIKPSKYTLCRSNIQSKINCLTVNTVTHHSDPQLHSKGSRRGAEWFHCGTHTPL